MALDSMEHQLFDWKSWDEAGSSYGDMTFHEVTLKVAIDEFPVGTKFKQATLFTELSVVSLTDDAGEDHIYQLHLTVGKKIDGEGLSLIL